MGSELEAAARMQYDQSKHLSELSVRLTIAEAKIRTLQADLDEANKLIRYIRPLVRDRGGNVPFPEDF